MYTIVEKGPKKYEGVWFPPETKFPGGSLGIFTTNITRMVDVA